MASIAPALPVVVDASVSVKWALNDEEFVAEAHRLRSDALLGNVLMYAPDLWLAEVVNALIVAVRRGRISQPDGALAVTALSALGVRREPIAGADLFAVARRFGVATFDAAYLVLAERLRAPLWTADRRFYNAVSQATPLVRWIGDY